jgi:hypothetical protein
MQAYERFLEFIERDCQRERTKVNRRMLYVLLWCFILPATVLVAATLLARFGIFPRGLRRYVDWMLLLFPIGYGLYIFGSEVLVELPNLFRRGGISSTLDFYRRESIWRMRVVGELESQLPKDRAARRTIARHFAADLDNLKYRVQYLTALAGAVFLLVMQTLDWFGDDEHAWRVGQAGSMGLEFLGRVEALSSGFAQAGSLAVFLVLFFLSGNQTYYLLKRYLVCLELPDTE